MALSVVIAVVRLTGQHKGLISEVSLIPWLLALAAALLVLGFLTAVGCKNMTVAAAERERDAAERAMRDRVSGVTRDLVLGPAGREIAEYERFRRAGRRRGCVIPLAAGRLSPCPLPRRAVASAALPQSEDRGAPFGSRTAADRRRSPGSERTRTRPFGHRFCSSF